MHLNNRPGIALPPDHYRQLLARAAGLGFISTCRRPPRQRVIDGMLARGFGRPKIADTGDGAASFRAHYGGHLITRTFSLNRDGSLPDHAILAALYMTADKMDARCPGAAKKKRGRADAGRRTRPPAPRVPWQLAAQARRARAGSSA